MNSTDIKSNEIVNENQPEKRAKGRPLTSRDGQKRTSRLTVLCSKEELERFNNLANNYGLSASQMTHKLFEMVELLMPEPYELNRDLHSLADHLRIVFQSKEVDLISTLRSRESNSKIVSADKKRLTTLKRQQFLQEKVNPD